MSSSLEQQLSYIVPAISITFLFVITSINVYFKIRRVFPATVNCWFCNVNSKVPYVNSNCWTCSSCEQYNGFTTDGDYNCDIPSQRSSKFNKTPNAAVRSLNGSLDGTSRIPSTPPSNGLCHPCNRNQELKMQQLASFEPENDAYFDEEVDDFRKKLEQAYRLCPRCERHLKRTLNNVKKNILGSKLAQLGAKGLHAFDLHFSTAKSDNKIQQRRQLFAKICLLAMIVISALTAYQTTAAIDINKKKLDAVLRPSATAAILIAASYISACKIIATRFIDYLVSLPYVTTAFGVWRLMVAYLCTVFGQTIWSSVQTTFLTEINNFSDGMNATTGEDQTIIANVAGCLLSIFVIFAAGLRFSTAFSLLLWTVHFLLATQIGSGVTPVLAVAVDAISLIVIWSSSFVSIWNFARLPSVQDYTAKSQSNNNSFHRIHSECGSEASDDSEVESELDASLQSDRSLRSGMHSLRRSNGTLNTSFVSQVPSNFSSTTYTVKKPHRASMHNLLQANRFDCDSIRRFDRANHLDLTSDIYDGNQSVYSTAAGSTFNRFDGRTHPSASLAGSVNQLYARDATTFGERCSSRLSMNDIPDEFESGITQLSISGVAKSREHYRNSNNHVSEAIAPFAFRQRKTLLLPARLRYDESNQQDSSIAANQSSWLAGGYWNNTTSPQKKKQFADAALRPNHSPQWQTNDMFPIISRTSSQSSGFESMKNCAECTTPPQQQPPFDDIDRLSMLSDRASIAHSRIDGKFTTKGRAFGAGNLFPNADHMTHNNLLINQKNLFLQNTNFAAKLVQKANSFETASLQKHLPFSNYENGTQSIDHQQNNFAKYPQSFAKFNNDLATFKKGSLLKIKAIQRTGPSNESSDMPFIDKLVDD